MRGEGEFPVQDHSKVPELISRRFGFLRSVFVPKCRALVLVGDTFNPMLRIILERR